MSKLENKLFSELTNKAGFYIKDYYSEYLKKNKWIAIMEKEEFIYAVIVCKDNESDFIYNESINFLSKLYLKSISLNIVINSVEDYDNLIQKNYNKVIYSEKEKQVVYSDSSCKPLVSIINYSKEDEEYSKKFPPCNNSDPIIWTKKTMKINFCGKVNRRNTLINKIINNTSPISPKQ